LRELVFGVLLAPLLVLAAVPPRRGQASEEAVFEAVLREQIEEYLDGSARRAGTVICLAVNQGTGPQSARPQLMKRFASDRAVRPAAACDPRPEGAIEGMTRMPAVVLTAGPIDWVAEDEAWVSATYFRSARSSASRRYRVVRQSGGWVSLGPILLDGPAS